MGMSIKPASKGPKTLRSGPLAQRAPAQYDRARQMLDMHKAIKQSAQAGKINKDQKNQQRQKIFDALDPKYNGVQRTDNLY